MFKRLRDYIYDISDVFVALVVIFAAAGVITWRASSLVEYPKYIEDHPDLQATIQQATESKAAQAVIVQPENRIIQASLNIESDFNGGWSAVADRLIAAKIIRTSDRDAFLAKVRELNLADRPKVGVFVLRSDMSFGNIIRLLCGER